MGAYTRENVFSMYDIEPGNDPCRNCGRTEVVCDYQHGDFICTHCGCVLGDGRELMLLPTVSATTKTHSPPQRRLWKRGFHCNERITLWIGTEPPIPKVDWAKIKAEAFSVGPNGTPKYGDPDNFDKGTVREILRSVTDDPEHVISRTRWVHYDKPFKRRTFAIYQERWLGILQALGRGRKYPQPSFCLVQRVKTMFDDLQRPFDAVRHKPGCKRRGPCHRGAHKVSTPPVEWTVEIPTPSKTHEEHFLSLSGLDFRALNGH